MDPDALQRLRKRLRHDLRSPLAVIVGRADLLTAEVAGPLTASQRRSIEEILRHALRLSDELAEAAEQLDALTAPPGAPPGAGGAAKKGPEGG